MLRHVRRYSGIFQSFRKSSENLWKALVCIRFRGELLRDTYRFLMLAQVINVITEAIRAIHSPTTITIKYTSWVKRDCVVQVHGGRHWLVSLSGIRGELHFSGVPVGMRRKIKIKSWVELFNSTMWRYQLVKWENTQPEIMLALTLISCEVCCPPRMTRVDCRFVV